MTGGEEHFVEVMQAALETALAPVRQQLSDHGERLVDLEARMEDGESDRTSIRQLLFDHEEAARERGATLHSLFGLTVTTQKTQEQLLDQIKGLREDLGELEVTVSRHERKLSPWREIWSGLRRVYANRNRLSKALMWLLAFLIATGQAWTIWHTIAQGPARP